MDGGHERYCYVREVKGKTGWKLHREVVYGVRPRDVRDFLNYLFWDGRGNHRVRRISGAELEHAFTNFYIDSWDDGGLMFNTRIPGV